jgi:hypothetical protein
MTTPSPSGHSVGPATRWAHQPEMPRTTVFQLRPEGRPDRLLMAPMRWTNLGRNLIRHHQVFLASRLFRRLA